MKLPPKRAYLCSGSLRSMIGLLGMRGVKKNFVQTALQIVTVFLAMRVKINLSLEVHMGSLCEDVFHLSIKVGEQESDCWQVHVMAFAG